MACCGLANDKAAAQSLRVALGYVVHNLHATSWQLLCLPLAAILAARNGDSRRAVELLGLTSTAPRNLMGWLDKWPLMANVKAGLKAQLGDEAYEAAWEYGKTLALDTVVMKLLD